MVVVVVVVVGVVVVGIWVEGGDSAKPGEILVVDTRILGDSSRDIEHSCSCIAGCHH
jgi:uncharacterized membrane protein YqiK